MRHVVMMLALALVLAVTSNLALAEEPAPGTTVDRPRAGPGEPPPPPHRPRGPRPYEGERRWREGYRPGGPDRVPPIFLDVTDEQIDSILAFISKYMPWRREALEKMRESEPDQFRQLCRRLRFEVGQLLYLKGRDEAAFHKVLEERQLRMRAVDLAAKARGTEDPKEKEALTAELRKVIDRMFELEMATHEAHIRGLEERIEQLRRELKDRAEHRRQVVEQRLKEALEREPEPPFRGPPKRGKHREEGPRPDKPRRDKPPPVL